MCGYIILKTNNIEKLPFKSKSMPKKAWKFCLNCQMFTLLNNFFYT